MGKRTPFYDLHLLSHARMVDFANWDMPLHYGSQLEEHHIVRQAAGMFDVSHMGVVDISGTDSTRYLQHLLANNVARLNDGKALYTCMLNDNGGVMDDLIVYRIRENVYRLVVNAGTRDKDLTWMRAHTNPFAVTVKERPDLAILAIQGPAVKNKMAQLFPEADMSAITQLKPFQFLEAGPFFIARTGYTGEDGFEIILPTNEAHALWQRALAADIKPCGLGARDTLRLEAGLNLYGNDMDETITPYEANLAWTVMMQPEERQFIGRKALENQIKVGIKRHLVGLVLAGPGIMRHDQKVFVNHNEVGVITSGGYSPVIGGSIAFARVIADIGKDCMIEIRQKYVPAQVVTLPFVRHGKKMF